MALTEVISLLRRQSRLFGVMAWTPFTLAMASVIGRLERDPFATDVRWKNHWARHAVPLIGLTLNVVRGSTARTHARGRLVIANHRTPLDVVALMRLFDDGHFLANHKVARAPVVGTASRRIGTVFVDREDRKSGVNAIRAMRRILEEGRTVIVFPEGTTFAGDEVRELKGGAFTAAKGLDIDVIPVGLAYTPGHELAGGRTGDHVRSFLARPSTPVWIAIGDPIPMSSLPTKGLEAPIRAAVQELVHAARRGAIEAGVGGAGTGQSGGAASIGEPR